MSIAIRSRVRRFAVGALASSIAMAGLLAAAPAAQAAKSGSCAAFAVTIAGKTYRGEQKVTLGNAAVAGKTATVKGTFIEFKVALDSFRVTNYTLTARRPTSTSPAACGPWCSRRRRPSSPRSSPAACSSS